MAQSEALSLIHTYPLYGAESTYNTAVAVTTQFGALISNFTGKITNNLTKNRSHSGTYDYEGRKVYKYTPGVLDIKCSLEMKPTNFRWFKYLLGTETGAGPYTYVPAAIPGSITIGANIDNPGSAATDQEATYSGCVFEDATIRSSVGEAVTCTCNLNAAKVIIDTTISSRVALPDEDPYNFAYGSIELPSGSTLSNIIDSIELTVKNNYKMLAGHGSRLVQNALPNGLDLSVKVTLKYLDNDLFIAALGATTPTATGGPTENATMVLNFGNPDGDTFEVTLSRVPMETFNQIHNLGDPLNEDIEFVAGDISCVETLA